MIRFSNWLGIFDGYFTNRHADFSKTEDEGEKGRFLICVFKLLSNFFVFVLNVSFS